MMKTILVILLCSLTSLPTFAESNEDDGDQQAIDKCIGMWKDSPFKKGEKDDRNGCDGFWNRRKGRRHR